jgi:hypothetical protein
MKIYDFEINICFHFISVIGFHNYFSEGAKRAAPFTAANEIYDTLLWQTSAPPKKLITCITRIALGNSLSPNAKPFRDEMDVSTSH